MHCGNAIAGDDIRLHSAGRWLRQGQDMKKTLFLVVGICGLAPTVITTPSAASIITPAGLSPGEKFRMVFTTSTPRDATSSNIADYDAFVSGHAVAAGLDSYYGAPVGWQVIGSTLSVSAISRIPLSSSSIYLVNPNSLAEVQIASSGADLWDGSIVNPILTDEFGRGVTAPGNFVHTGTQSNGETYSTAALGDPNIVVTGTIFLSDQRWIGGGSAFPSTEFHFYGISEELTVGASFDFNEDGVVDCSDIDSLVVEIAHGTNDSSFDLTGDGLVTLADRDAWLADAGGANLASGNPYLLGDANLDGVVDVRDFNLWNASAFTGVGAWCQGDFNADGAVDISDFNVWNARKFQSSDGTMLVPEPGALWMAIVVTASAVRRRFQM